MEVCCRSAADPPEVCFKLTSQERSAGAGPLREGEGHDSPGTDGEEVTLTPRSCDVSKEVVGGSQLRVPVMFLLSDPCEGLKYSDYFKY